MLTSVCSDREDEERGPLCCKLMSQSAEMNDQRELNSTTFSFCYLRSVFCCSRFTAVLQTKYSSEQFIIEPTQQICKNIWYITKNSNLQLIQYKILHRVHYTAQKMPKLGLLRCEICTHTYLHALWLCRLVQQFSVQVTRSLSTMIGCLSPLSACLCLLGDTTTITDDVHNPKQLLIALTIGKETIPVNWKTRTTVSLNPFTFCRIFIYISLFIRIMVFVLFFLFLHFFLSLFFSPFTFPLLIRLYYCP